MHLMHVKINEANIQTRLQKHHAEVMLRIGSVCCFLSEERFPVAITPATEQQLSMLVNSRFLRCDEDQASSNKGAPKYSTTADAQP